MREYGPIEEVIKVIASTEEQENLLLCVGNPIREDDGVGVYIGKTLSKIGYNVINAEQNPENYIDEIISKRPKNLIIVDAAQFNGKPGDVMFVDAKNIPETSISTHTIPLSVISAIIHNETGSNIFFIGIQIKSMEYKEKLNKEVKETADFILKKLTSRRQQCTN